MLLRSPLQPLLRPLLRLPTDAAVGGGAVTLTSLIAALYPASEEGAVYEGDFASGYQDSPGTTAITAVDDPVGRRLDKRFALVRGPELVTNGDGSSVAGWSATSATLASVGGEMEITATGAGFSLSSRTIATTAGKTYELTSTQRGGTSATARGLQAGTAQGTGNLASAQTSGALPLRMVFVAAGATTWVDAFGGSGAVAGQTCYFDNISVKLLDGNHSIQATAGARPLEKLIGSNYADQFDGGDDSQDCATGGGGTTGLFWCGAVRVIGGAGGSRSVWSDTGTNSGYRVRIASTNKLAIGAGDGVGFTSATTTDAVDVGNTYVLCVWDDGVNLNAQVNLGTVATAARPVVTAGTAGFTRGKENGSATLFANIAIVAEFYKKNGSGVSAATRLACQQYCAAKAGITI